MKISLSRALMVPLAGFGPYFMAYDAKASGVESLIHFAGALALSFGLLMICKKIDKIEEVLMEKKTNRSQDGGK